MARLTEGREAQTSEDQDQREGAGKTPVSADPASAEVAAEVAAEPDHSMKFVFIGLALVSVIVGVLGYWRYASSEQWVVEGVAKMDALGPKLDAEGCVDEVVGWYNDCDQHDANAAVCLQGVGILMQHCLSARERTQTCELYLNPESAAHAVTDDMRARARNPDKAGGSGRWVYARCEERDMVCRNKRECACAEAYRAIDSFCRTGEEAVQL
ncbi:hypothetical protein ENSA5_30370 [Enhygromyxa salina]|uniref:Uncharacterized protein n=1 Tax=Enhygromyxa salina TaxID=215803 RepID=A0A2S9XZL7_9BACT|nr:hypothetical protein [Enhygromyxa salina]PRP98304.1 hypothetical protein ENSA5_30370 [Enhygromyxa salina]